MPSEYDSHSDDDEEIVVSKRKRNIVLDDDSDEDTTTDVLNQTNKSDLDDDLKNNDSPTKDDPVNDNAIVDSSEIDALPKDKGDESGSDDDDSSEDESLSKNPTREKHVTDDEDSNHSETSSKNSKTQEEKKYTFDPSIYDAEESDEENRSKTPEPIVEDEGHYEVPNKHPKSKKSTGKEKSSKQQNKPKKEKPSDNMREIRRESQRMLRESRIILPYHIPKQRTLAEFLNRKKSLPSMPIRTTAEQLLSFSKQIEQQEKESQEFFKSDSSDNDDDNDDKDYVPDDKDDLPNNENKSETTSAQDDKSNEDDNKCDSSKVDENFNKEKVIDDSSLEIVVGESGGVKVHENVTNLLAEVAEKLQNEVSDNSVKETGKNEELDENIIDNESVLGEKNDSTTTRDGTISTLQQGHDDESDSEDFTLDLTMPEDGENTEDKERNTEKSSTLNPTLIGDSETIMEEDKENEDSFTLDLTMPEDSVTIVERDEAKNNEGLSGSTLTKDSVNVVEDKEKEKYEEESFTLNLTLPEDSETVGEEVNEKDIEYSETGVKGSKEKDVGVVSSRKDDKSSKLKKLELLSKIHFDLTEVPTLSKSFGGEINLDSPPKKAEVIDFRERFLKHYAMDRKKKPSKSPVKISVVSATVDDKGYVEDISTEIINTSSKPDEQWLEEIKEAELPGAKHSKLKQFLQSKAKAKWKEDYEKRLQEYKMNEDETVEGDKADYEHEAILDDEDEEEDMTNSEEEEEEEPEENDVELVDKKRKQSKFVEDEADEEDEDDNGDREEEEEEEEEDVEEEVVEENEDVLLGYNESDDEDDDSEEKRKRRKKMVKKRKTVSDGESEEDESEDEEESGSESPKRKRKLIASENEESGDDDGDSPKRKTKLMSSDNEEASQSMEDLAGLCSGKFPTQPVSFSQLEMADSDNLLKGFADSQNLDLSLPEQSQSLDRSKEDSEEEEEGDTKRMKKSILDSDNEDGEDDEIVLNRSHKKKSKAVEYSDDEDEKTEPQNDDDDVGSENSEELVLDEIGNEDVELEYDSEENEVIRDPKAFFDKEAELSESEWGSEDEDEKDLDKFEEEAGDQEVLDHDQVNRELGKIHMQQMLVEDKREVRILQELLLEDGELHSDGSGRQRQFRWANADSGFAGDANTKDSDEEDSDQEEDEENWRKKRHERELFLNKKNERLKELGIEEEDDDDDEEEEEGGLLDVGRALVKKLQTSAKPAAAPPTSKVSAAAVAMNCKFMSKNMRGSFLTSSDHYLSRLAHITTKVGSEGKVNGPKNSRNFVFSIISPKKDEVKEAEPEENNKMKKRKASENAANAKKKIHFSDDKGNQKPKSLLEALG